MKLTEVKHTSSSGGGRPIVVVWMSTDEGDINDITGPFNSMEAAKKHIDDTVEYYRQEEGLEEDETKELYDSARVRRVTRA